MNGKNLENRHEHLPHRWTGRFHSVGVLLVLIALSIFPSGCDLFSGYSNEPLYPQDVKSIYVEMFDNRSFWRSVEYELTDALAKRIEAETPYKIISDRNRADSIISGQILSVGQSVLSLEREVGRALEKEIDLQAVVNWKNLKTGELLIDNRSVAATATYSQFQSQSLAYASALAANNLAERIVELMEKQW